MKNLLFGLTILGFGVTASAASTTLLKCAVGEVGSEGARVNIIQNAKGEIKANLIFGTTVSGTLYRVTQTPDGFIGTIRNKPRFTIKLIISSESASNKYISGQRASLSAVFPDLRESSGVGQIITPSTAEFVCGKQIADYGS